MTMIDNTLDNQNQDPQRRGSIIGIESSADAISRMRLEQVDRAWVGILNSVGGMKNLEAYLRKQETVAPAPKPELKVVPVEMTETAPQAKTEQQILDEIEQIHADESIEAEPTSSNVYQMTNPETEETDVYPKAA